MLLPKRAVFVCLCVMKVLVFAGVTDSLNLISHSMLNFVVWENVYEVDRYMCVKHTAHVNNSLRCFEEGCFEILIIENPRFTKVWTEKKFKGNFRFLEILIEARFFIVKSQRKEKECLEQNVILVLFLSHSLYLTKKNCTNSTSN